MPNAENYDLAYGPETYRDLSDALTALLSRIKGEARKRDARKLLETGEMAHLREFLLAEGLPDSTLNLVSRMDPMLMGGEYLPDYEEGEVEVARVSLESMTGDVISIRARPAAEGIRYRVVDEYETVFDCTPEVSEPPLTMGELIDLLDGSYADDWQGTGLVSSWRDDNLHDDDPEEAESLVDFVTVSSDLYPQLQQWYEEEAQEWLDRIRSKSHDES
jgi:hypothetical protein